MSLRSLRLGLPRLLHKDAAESELADEVAHYLEQSTNEHMGRGLSREAAERAARLEFGGIEAVKEQVRDGGWEAVVETLWRDVRYCGRGLRRNPLFTLATAVTLALGIGANTAMFSVVNGIMLRPFLYHDSDRLVFLWTSDVKRGLDREATAYSTILDWRREARTFEQIAFFNGPQRAILGSHATRERTETAFTSANLMPLLGVPPLKGRWMTEDDERRAAPVAVISHALWQRRFASDPDIVGKPIELIDWQTKVGSTALVVVGVMPPGFSFPNRRTDVWVPATAYWRWTRESTERFPSWARRWIGVRRLKPHVSTTEAHADLSRIGAHLSSVYASDIPDFPGFAVSVVSLLDYVAGKELQLALWLLMGAVALVLLVACTTSTPGSTGRRCFSFESNSPAIRAWKARRGCQQAIQGPRARELGTRCSGISSCDSRGCLVWNRQGSSTTCSSRAKRTNRLRSRAVTHRPWQPVSCSRASSRPDFFRAARAAPSRPLSRTR